RCHDVQLVPPCDQLGADAGHHLAGRGGVRGVVGAQDQQLHAGAPSSGAPSSATGAGGSSLPPVSAGVTVAPGSAASGAARLGAAPPGSATPGAAPPGVPVGANAAR